MIRIDYESDGFPAGGPVANGYSVLDTSWDELLWAALTVGRPNRQYVFKHGLASQYEALFRLSLTRMALEQAGPMAYRLRRTDAAKTLDPTEKGAVNYFLGMALCKLFAARLLGAPWMLHLDVFRPQLNPVLTGRSRPDLVGHSPTNGWVAMESKGRVSSPSTDAKNKAKQQATRLVGVNGTMPSYHIAGITYFRNDVLRFFWRDPEPEQGDRRRTIRINLEDNAWEYYYAPVVELIRSVPDALDRMTREAVLIPVEAADIEVGIHPVVLPAVVNAQWETAMGLCHRHAERLHQAGYQADGTRVVAGQSWLAPFDESEGQRER